MKKNDMNAGGGRTGMERRNLAWSDNAELPRMSKLADGENEHRSQHGAAADAEAVKLANGVDAHRT